MIARFIACALVVLAVTLQRPWAGATEAPLVAAASDLQFALAEVAEAYAKHTGQTVRLSFGSSGNFARQIRQGAPFEVFFSADEQYVFDLARDGFLRDRGELYAIGRIALFVPRGSPLKPDATLADLGAALREGRISKFAIANPEHAPYGRRAEEALRRAGLWEAIRPRLVIGENAAQAAQFAASGSAQGGIVPYSLAVAPRLAALGAHALIAEDWHAPLRQRMALAKNAGPAAVRFYEFVQSPPARAILRKHGFVLPGRGRLGTRWTGTRSRFRCGSAR
ncbi:MAG: molybdate ABC transporter substrate-binding protein [Burkholderiales bacterium]|nr:molybdate ABC transporter substrate-binding protein [Burkholderiales bacterium]